VFKEILKRKNPWLRECIWEQGEFNPENYSKIFLFFLFPSVKLFSNNPLLHAEPDPDFILHIKNLSRKQPKFNSKDDNVFLDIQTKKAALKASSSVVALLSYTAGIVFYSTLQFLSLFLLIILLH